MNFALELLLISVRVNTIILLPPIMFPVVPRDELSLNQLKVGTGGPVAMHVRVTSLPSSVIVRLTGEAVTPALK